MNKKQIIILASILLILLLPIAEAKLLKIFSWGGTKLKSGMVTGRTVSASNASNASNVIFKEPETTHTGTGRIEKNSAGEVQVHPHSYFRTSPSNPRFEDPQIKIAIYTGVGLNLTGSPTGLSNDLKMANLSDEINSLDEFKEAAELDKRFVDVTREDCLNAQYGQGVPAGQGRLKFPAPSAAFLTTFSRAKTLCIKSNPDASGKVKIMKAGDIRYTESNCATFSAGSATFQDCDIAGSMKLGWNALSSTEGSNTATGGVTCVDSDGGSVPSVFGQTQKTGGSLFKDECFADIVSGFYPSDCTGVAGYCKINEYSCTTTNNVENRNLACPTGTGCINGACKPTSDPLFNPAPATGCSETDSGAEHSVRGTVTLVTNTVTAGGTVITGQALHTDACQTNNILREFYCNAHSNRLLTLEFYNCPNGCENGACKPAPECTSGATRTCNTGEQGICSAGTQTCQSTGQWGSCARNTGPTTEACDGQDNDCDGTPDDNIGSTSAPCTAGTGICERQGTTTTSCTGGQMVTNPCNAVAGQPGTEQCGNGIDEDCNGADEACPPLAAGQTRTNTIQQQTQSVDLSTGGADVQVSTTGTTPTIAPAAGTTTTVAPAPAGKTLSTVTAAECAVATANPQSSVTLQAGSVVCIQSDGQLFALETTQTQSASGATGSAVRNTIFRRTTGRVISVTGRTASSTAPVLELQWKNLGTVPPPQPEICDGLDNDNDGTVDEDDACYVRMHSIRINPPNAEVEFSKKTQWPTGGAQCAHLSIHDISPTGIDMGFNPVAQISDAVCTGCVNFCTEGDNLNVIKPLSQLPLLGGREYKLCTQFGKCSSIITLPCYDDDGGRTYNKQGITSGKSASGPKPYFATQDSCQGTNLVEAYCQANDVVATETVTCQSGTTCQNGACVALPPTCVDGDSGRNYETASSIRYTNHPQGLVEEFDVCLADTSTLQERLCNDPADNTRNVAGFQCPNGCRDGRCLTAEEAAPPTPPPVPLPVPVQPPILTACAEAENRVVELERQFATKEREAESKKQERNGKRKECEKIENTNPCKTLKGQQKNDCKKIFDQDKKKCRTAARQLQEQFNALNREKQVLQEQLSRVQAQREKACQPSRPLPDLAIDTTKTGFYNKKINEFIYDADNPLSFSDNVVEGQRLRAAVKFVNVGEDTPLHLVSTEVIFKKDGNEFFRSRVDTPPGATQNSFSRPYNVYIDTNAQTAEEVETIKLTPAGRYCLDINVDFNSLLAEKPEGEGPANKFTDVGCINVEQPTSTPPLGAVVTRAVTPTGRTIKSFRVVG